MPSRLREISRIASITLALTGTAGIASPVAITSSTLVSRRRPSAPPGCERAKSAGPKPRASRQATASASPSASIAVVEEVGDFGMVDIFAVNKDSIEAAKERIKKIVAIPEVGLIYNGKVKSIVAFGAFIEILPGKEGLLHISEIDWKRVEDANKYLKVGQMVDVKLIGIDTSTGKMKLSRKVLLPQPPKTN